MYFNLFSKFPMADTPTLRFASSTNVQSESSAALARFQAAEDEELVPKVAAAYEKKQKEFMSWLETTHDICIEEAEDLEAITIDHIKEFLGGLKNKKGDRAGLPCLVGTLSTYRSAIRKLWVKNKKLWPFDMELKAGFKGLKKETGRMRQEGELPPRAGKCPMSLKLYHTLCSALFFTFQSKTRANLSFAAAYLSLCWNLMGRSSSIAGILFSHINWDNDSLTISVPTHKGDKEGARASTGDPRHIYANPFEPAICPVLLLGVYLLVTPFTESDEHLFVGGSQNKKFYCQLKDQLKSGPVERVIHEMGLSVSDVATHSPRKGASSYVCGGTTMGPHIASVILRAGWSFGGVEDRYIRYERAGDQFVGRTVCGLDIMSSNFAILPPHFCIDNLHPTKRRTIMESLRVCFPSLHHRTNLLEALEMMLASVVYHTDFLQANLNDQHPLFLTPLFTNKIRGLRCIDALRELLHFGNKCSTMTATGLPPHVNTWTMIEDLREDVQKINTDLNEKMVPVFLEGMENLLEEHGTIRGNATSRVVEERMKGVLEEAGFFAMRDSIEELLRRHNGKEPDVNAGLLDALCADGLPNNFSLAATFQQAFQLWFIGNANLRLPPYRRLGDIKMPRKYQRPYSEWKGTMKYSLEVLQNIRPDLFDSLTRSTQPSIAIVQECFCVIGGQLPHDMYQSKQKRRPSQLKISTVSRYILKMKKNM